MLLNFMCWAVLGYFFYRWLTNPPGHPAKRPVRSRRSHPLAAEYAALGLPPGSTAEKVNAAYREKAKRFHPDALAARGADAATVAAAKNAMARLNAARDAVLRSVKESGGGSRRAGKSAFA